MLLDSNVLIEYLNGKPKVVKTLGEWKKDNQPLYISSIVYTEVLALRDIEEGTLSRIREFLQSFPSLPFDNRVGDVASYLRRLYELKLPDAAIAGTAVVYGIPLVTNDKVFKKVKEIKVVRV